MNGFAEHHNFKELLTWIHGHLIIFKIIIILHKFQLVALVAFKFRRLRQSLKKKRQDVFSKYPEVAFHELEECQTTPRLPCKSIVG